MGNKRRKIWKLDSASMGTLHDSKLFLDLLACRNEPDKARSLYEQYKRDGNVIQVAILDSGLTKKPDESWSSVKIGIWVTMGKEIAYHAQDCFTPIDDPNYKTELNVSWRDTTELNSDVVELLEILGEIEKARPFNTIYKDVL